MQSAISCITMLVLISFQVSLSRDTLRQGDSLTSTSLLVSAGNIFSLGFFTPNDNSNTYLAIWYINRWSHNPPVWIANRDNPVPNNSNANLTISITGSLLITTGEEYTFSLFANPEARQNVSATLLDTGNFVLQEVSMSGENVVLWQSFDYPTNTLLPGMKLCVNRRTGRRRKLTSWLSSKYPASGPLTLEWENITRRLIVRQRGVFYWTSGKLTDYYDRDYNLRVKEFENLPAPNPLDFNYSFSNITSNGEDCFMYSLLQVPHTTDRIFSGWTLAPDGEGLIEINNDISMTGSCTDSAAGCRCSDRREFLESYGFFRLPNGESPLPVLDENSDIGDTDCRESCLNDCECSGFAMNASGCWYWIGRNLKFEANNASIYLRTFLSTRQDLHATVSFSPKRMLMWIIIAVVTALLVLVVAALVLKRRSKQRKREAEMNELLTLAEMYDHGKGGSKGHDLRPFTYATLAAATSNFSPDYKLGEGGFGPVYKGQTTEGHEIAVKVLSRSSGQGLLEFKNEITLISKLQHVNLVKLVGFCIHGEDKIIVYDYLPNKSLDFFLFDPTKKEQLDWGRRFNIIEGISQGLLYLHKYSRLNIVHRDLKSSNILLDENLNPKISDFGLARIFKQNADEANTNRRVGTYGYMAPEYAMQGIFSFKSDVYSFGVMLLEIVSGRKNSSFQDIEGPLNLVEYAWELWSKDSVLELMDSTLSSSCNIEQVQRCVIIGLLCVENRASDRPDIEGIISMLKNEMTPLPLPKNPAFITRNRALEELGKSSSGKLSANEISISEAGGR